MGETNWDSDDDDFDADDNAKNQQTPKGLRAHAKKLEAENAEFRKRLEEFEATNRKATLEKAISAKGLNPKVAGLVPKDVTPDAVDKWLDDFGDVFGKAEQREEQREPSVEEQLEYEEMNRISSAAGRGESPSRGADLYSELTDKNLTPERLMQMIESAGGGYGA